MIIQRIIKSAEYRNIRRYLCCTLRIQILEIAPDTLGPSEAENQGMILRVASTNAFYFIHPSAQVKESCKRQIISNNTKKFASEPNKLVLDQVTRMQEPIHYLL